MKEKRKIVCTGSKGFLGSYITKLFKEKDYEIIDFDLPEHDLLTDDFSCLDDADGVIHCAAMKGIPICNKMPVKAVEVNVLGTVRLLEACYQKEIKNFLYISTWAVNSKNKKMYDVTKKAAEELVLHYIKRKKLPGKILRLATLYGAGMDSAGCIDVFIRKAKENKPAPIFGNGWEVRQFLHVRDCAEGIFTAYHCPISEKPYVVTSKEVININSLGKQICNEIEHLPQQDDYENYEVLYATDLENNGWKQKITLDEGIKELMENDNM